jgi:hypothetical protein
MCRIFSLCGRASRSGTYLKTFGERKEGSVQFVIISLISGFIFWKLPTNPLYVLFWFSPFG